MKIENNWYSILELEYYPNPVENKDKIKKRIEEKKEFWSRNTIDFRKGAEYRRYLDFLNKGIIEEEMFNTYKRKEMINELQKKLFEVVDEILDVFSYDQLIPEKVIENFSKKENIDKNLMKIRINEKGRRIDTYNEEVYLKYCEIIEKKYKFTTIEQNLAILNQKNLYDFLNSEGIDVEISNFEEILKNIALKRQKLKKSDSETSAKRNLFNECEDIFKNSQKRTEYDEYLEYLNYLEVKKELEKVEILSKNADLDSLKRKSLKYIDKIKKILGNEDIAKDIFIGFCKQKKIPYSLYEDTEKPKQNHQQWKNQSNNGWSRTQQQNQQQQRWKEQPNNGWSRTQQQNQQQQQWKEQPNNGWSRTQQQDHHHQQWQPQPKESQNPRSHNPWNPNDSTSQPKSKGSSGIWIIIGSIVVLFVIISMWNTMNKNKHSGSSTVSQSQQSDQSEQSQSQPQQQNSTSSQTIEQSYQDNSQNTEEGYLSNNSEFYATDNTMTYYGSDSGAYVTVEVQGNSVNTGGDYNSLVIEDLIQSRYLMMKDHDENGVNIPLSGRIFKFRCGISKVVKNGKLYVNAEDVRSYRDQRRVNMDADLVNGECIRQGVKVNKEIDVIR